MTKATIIIDENDEVDIRTENGSIAVLRHNQEFMLIDLYQDRFDPKIEVIDWDKLAEGKMYCLEFPKEQKWTSEMLYTALKWLHQGEKEFCLTIKKEN